jgi:hypothetical protein
MNVGMKLSVNPSTFSGSSQLTGTGLGTLISKEE